MAITRVPTPHEIGLPEQFERWRPEQEDCLRELLTRPERIIAEAAPVGFGKTAVVVAHALITNKSTCFVTESRGLQDQYMCIAPNTKICTGDLRWVAADTVAAGDTLLGFDEERSPHRRHWRPSVVETTRIVEKPCVELHLSGGTRITCSEDHKWLVKVQAKGSPVWVETRQLIAGKSALLQVLDTWDTEVDYAAGYLAAAFEGEGHLHQSRGDNGADVNLSFAQKSNVMLQQVKRLLDSLGYHYSESVDKFHCHRLTISHRREVLRFLGEIRPERLLLKLNLSMMGMLNPALPVRIRAIRPLGIKPVVFIQTTTRTFVAEGFASHNSTFGPCGMVDLRGRRNYDCHMRPDYSCQEGYAAGCPHKGSMACPSTAAETRAASSRLVVTNYDKWTSSRKFGRGMEHFEQVVFDEGHKAPAALERAMSITLHAREVEDGLGIDFPRGADEMVNWVPWARMARLDCQERYQTAKADVDAGDYSHVKEMLRLRYLLKRLTVLSTANPQHWVVDGVKDGYQFDPIRSGRYAESILLLKIPKIIIISGTLRPKTLFMLGLPKTAFYFNEYVSSFDPKRCPIYYLPTMRVDKNAHDLTPLWIKLDQIAGRRQDRRGIIHPISYLRQQDVVSSSRFSSKMLLGAKGQGAGDIVEMFRHSPVNGSILVSPAVSAGYDFPQDAAEWQFICKVPFPDGRAKILKARQADDPEYGAAQAANDLQQMAGRIMRSATDQGETFICDEHMGWFYGNDGRAGRYHHLFSKTFKRFFRQIDTVPAPLPKL